MKKALTYLFVAILVSWLAWRLWPTPDQPDTTSNYLDMHVHTAGLGYGESGAFINEQMANSYKFPIYLWAMGVTEDELVEEGDGIVIKKLARRVRNSSRVSSAVILAMDGVIDANGTLDRDRTQIYVPNDFVAREVARYPELEFGASVNPARPDAIERLRQVKQDGALLIKWIPNIMLIDPADPAHTEFYREMARLRLPLLSHAGQERSFAGAEDLYGDPMRLRLPLELGVTVIAAHIATTGEIEGEANFERFLRLFPEYPNLYTEVSSLTQVNKLNYLARALEIPALQERMLYGTDWPLQFFPLVSPMYHANHIGVDRARQISTIEQVWDRDVALKEALGVPHAAFNRSRALLMAPVSQSEIDIVTP